MKIVLIIYFATIGFYALTVLTATLEMVAYVRKHNLKRRETITSTERIAGNLKLLIIGILPIINFLVAFSVLSNEGHRQMEKTIQEQFCEEEE